MKSSAPVRLTFCILSGLLLLWASDAQSQNVTTWHFDNNRTGWQQNETSLTPASVSGGFGLVWRATNLVGSIYAEPLAVSGVAVPNNPNCPCDLIFVATEQDELYALSAATGAVVWNTNLAGQIPGGSYVYCSAVAIVFAPCEERPQSGTTIGITGTPVIDIPSNTMYVVAAVNQVGIVNYYLFAVDIRNGQILGYIQITGVVTGKTPPLSRRCMSMYPQSGTVTFDSNHNQRASLLLLNGNTVYIPFSPGGDEFENGWILGYAFTPHVGLGTFTQVAAFVPTPYGSGGGIWQSGAGLAAETVQGNTYIYAATGNGTFNPNVSRPYTSDLGDSLLKLAVHNDGSLAIADYYTAADNFTYTGAQGNGRCLNNVDFGSGGVMLMPEAFYLDQNTNTFPNMAFTSDKESKFYVLNRDRLGKFNPSGANSVQIDQTPSDENDNQQGYWSSGAYWKFVDGNGQPNYRLYYSVTTTTASAPPHPVDMYDLSTSGTSGPIPIQPTVSTQTLFCIKSPTPSVSSNGTLQGTGIVWAIEHPNLDQNDCAGPSRKAVLHAFDATSMAEIYSSSSQYVLGGAVVFSTPTIFKGQVYIGTLAANNAGEIDAFGLCNQPGGCQ